MIDHEQIENGSFEGKIDWIIIVKETYSTIVLLKLIKIIRLGQNEFMKSSILQNSN